MVPHVARAGGIVDAAHAVHIDDQTEPLSLRVLDAVEALERVLDLGELPGMGGRRADRAEDDAEGEADADEWLADGSHVTTSL